MGRSQERRHSIDPEAAATVARTEHEQEHEREHEREHGHRPGRPRARSSRFELRGLTRSRDDRVIAGVCGGIGRWLRVDPVVVRIAFVVFAVSGGVGVVAYLVLWLAMPSDRRRAASARAGRQGSCAAESRAAVSVRERSRRVLAVTLIAAGGLLFLRELGLWIGDRFVWPIALGVVGLALAWPDTGGTAGWRALASRLPGVADVPSPEVASAPTRVSAVRIGLGVAALAGGVTLFAVANTDVEALRDALLAALVTLAGVVLIFGPWWWRLGRDLVEERRQRIRMQERTEMAARVHDSVLQTLALIQQKADDHTEITRLARRQERELRSWLFGGDTPEGRTLRSAVATAADEVEDLYGITVERVAVGDRPLDEDGEALVAAAREALVNAAKFSGAPTVSLYVEVDDAGVTAFVRDRGAGFDRTVVPADRRGISESIEGRMERRGGRAVVRTAPGEGTEVELWLPKA